MDIHSHAWPCMPYSPSLCKGVQFSSTAITHARVKVARSPAFELMGPPGY